MNREVTEKATDLHQRGAAQCNCMSSERGHESRLTADCANVNMFLRGREKGKDKLTRILETSSSPKRPGSD